MASEDDRTLPVNRDHDDDVEKTLPQDSTVPNDASTDATLDIEIGPYRIIRELGRGGMGVVYLATDMTLKRRVALKVMGPGFASSPLARERFRREAEAASRLEHPGICGVIGIGEHDGTPWIAMRYVEGEPLSNRTRQSVNHESAATETASRRDSYREDCHLIERIALALNQAHESGIIHRDLKPGNVMVTTRGEPVVLDFGLAHDLDDEGPGLTGSGDVLGTPFYMAPEQVRGDGGVAAPTLDVWSLGVMLYELLTGERPFTGTTRQALFRNILEQEPTRLRKLAPKLPVDLETVVTTALEKEPAKRYATAGALAADIRAVLDHRPIQARPIGPVGRTVRFARRRPALFALFCVLIVGAPTTITLVVMQRLTRTRVLEVVEGHLQEVQRELDRRNPAAAAAALQDARTLAPTREFGSIVSRIRYLDDLERAETLALDAETDPDGRFALQELTRLRSAHPDAVLPILLEAYVMLRNGNRDGVAARRDRLLEIGADDSASAIASALAGEESAEVADRSIEVGLFDALAASASGHHLTALRRLERLMERRPESHALAWFAATEAERHQSIHAALAFAGRARVLAGTLSPRRQARYGTLLREAGHLEESEREVRAAAQRAPDDLVVLLHLANVLAIGEDRKDATPLFERILEESPTFFEAWRGAGALQYDDGDYESAITSWRRGLDVREDATLHLNIGNAQIELGRHDDAVTSIHRALEIRPDFPFALNSLGAALRSLKRPDEARAALERAIELQPSYAVAHANLGTIERIAGNLERAEKCFRNAFRIDPDVKDTAFNFALLLQGTNRETEAMEFYRRAIREDESHASAMSNLSGLLSGAEQHEEAVAMAQQAVKAAPDDAICWSALGAAHAAAQQGPQAIEAFRRAAVIAPGRLEFHANLMLLLTETDPIAAIAHALEATRIDKEFLTRARQNLLILRRKLESGHPEHALTLALEAASPLDSVDEEAKEMLEDAIDEYANFDDGEPGSDDFCIKRSLAEALTFAAARLKIAALFKRMNKERERLATLAARPSR